LTGVFESLPTLDPAEILGSKVSNLEFEFSTTCLPQLKVNFQWLSYCFSLQNSYIGSASAREGVSYAKSQVRTWVSTFFHHHHQQSIRTAARATTTRSSSSIICITPATRGINSRNKQQQQ
jgi:hypothetical protein